FCKASGGPISTGRNPVIFMSFYCQGGVMVSTKPIVSSDHRAASALRCDRCAAWPRVSKSICHALSFLKVRNQFPRACQVAAPRRFIITITIERALQALRQIAGGNNRAVSARLCGYCFHLHESRTNTRPRSVWQSWPRHPDLGQVENDSNARKAVLG